MLYISTAKVLSILGKEQEARQIMLLACKNKPTPHTWTIAGTFFFNVSVVLINLHTNYSFNIQKQTYLLYSLKKKLNDESLIVI